MMRKAFKWMMLTLLLAGLLICAAVRLIAAIRSAAPTAAELPSAAPTDTPAAATLTPAPQTPAPTPTTAPPTATPDPLGAYINRMSLTEKLGQLVMFGGSGTTAPDGEFSEILQTYQVGNVVLFGANINSGRRDGGFSDAARLTAALQERGGNQLPLLISIDVEGGRVVRFGWDPRPASASALGERGDPAMAYRQFCGIAERLSEAGINMNLAPVLDVSQNPSATFLGTRIISSDPTVVGEIGAAVIEGIHDGGCLATAKHFPGHGGTKDDSHKATPVVDRSEEWLRRFDLVPFAAAVEAEVDVILVAHILYPAFDADNIASLSPAIITDLLRGELGFDGIIMSDDFRMGGLTEQCDVGEAAVRFLLAGGDLILCGPRHDYQREIMRALHAAAADGTLRADRIDESVMRILQKKMRVTDWTPLRGDAG